MTNWLLLSLIALVAWGITGNTQKLSTNCISTQFSFFGFTLAFIPVALLTVALFPVSLALPRDVVALGVLSGVLNGFGALTSFAAFEKGAKSAVAVPVMYLYPLITVLLAYVLLNEHISAAHWAGIVLAPIAAWLLSAD
ncbi:MAG: DMT family transporter [Acidobacteriales bacterium]|nr:DMT family transporter [Terriglobales bacterium]